MPPSPLPRLEETRPSGHGRARGLVSGRQSGRRVEARTFAPPPELADVVACFWTGRWDLRGEEPHVAELLGDPCVHLVCEGGDRREARVVGVWTRLWTRTLEGRGFVRGVKLRAGAAAAFLPRPLVALTNRIASVELIGAGTERIWRRMLLAPADDEAAFSAWSGWLERSRRCDRASVDYARVMLASALMERIAKDPSIRTVEALAAVAGLGRRDLQRLFRDFVGAPAKWSIRRHRLQEVALRLERGEVTSLADLAAEWGYADQAHLCRDFRAAVGKTPSFFAATVNR